MTYRELKYRKKHGNSSWKYRPYWYAKGTHSRFEMILNFRDNLRLEERRAERIFYKQIKRRDWNGDKLFPKLAKKYFNYLSIEDKVLKKHLWRI